MELIARVKLIIPNSQWNDMVEKGSVLGEHIFTPPVKGTRKDKEAFVKKLLGEAIEKNLCPHRDLVKLGRKSKFIEFEQEKRRLVVKIAENTLVGLFVPQKTVNKKAVDSSLYGSLEIANRARELYKVSKVKAEGNILDVTLDCIKCHESKVPKPLRLKIEVVK